MEKIKVEVKKGETVTGRTDYQTVLVDFDGENIIIPEGVYNIVKIKERSKKVFSSIKGIILPETVDLSTELTPLILKILSYKDEYSLCLGEEQY